MDIPGHMMGTCFDSNIVVECKTWSEARHLKSHRLILPVFIGSEMPACKQSAGWNVELLLDSIIEASHQGRCNALIDTGALITGLTNQEVGGNGNMKGGEKERMNITVKDERFTDIRCKGLSPMSWLSFFSSVVRP